MGTGSENKEVRGVKFDNHIAKYGKTLNKMKDDDVSKVINSLITASGAKSSSGLSKKLGSLVSDKSTKSQYSTILKTGDNRLLIKSALREYTEKGRNSSKFARTVASSVNKLNSDKAPAKKTSAKKTTKTSSGKSAKSTKTSSTSGGTTTRKMTAAEMQAKFDKKPQSVDRGFTRKKK